MLARALAAAAVLSLLVLVPATAAQTGGGFKVTSTLDGKPVLPHRIHWLGLSVSVGREDQGSRLSD